MDEKFLKDIIELVDTSVDSVKELQDEYKDIANEMMKHRDLFAPYLQHVNKISMLLQQLGKEVEMFDEKING